MLVKLRYASIKRNSVMVVKEYDSPCGVLYMASIGNELCLCSWHGLSACHGFISDLKDASDYKEEWDVLEKAERELEEYFEGMRQTFDIPLKMFGTEFQKKVWNALLGIPYGETVSYSNVARLIGLPRSTRAVANACSKNPLSIFVPCHRVVSTQGKLTGYAGGVEVKRKLLDLERADMLFGVSLDA